SAWSPPATGAGVALAARALLAGCSVAAGARMSVVGRAPFGVAGVTDAPLPTRACVAEVTGGCPVPCADIGNAVAADNTAASSSDVRRVDGLSDMRKME